MPTPLIVLLSIPAVLVLIAMIRVKAHVTSAGNLALELKILFFKFPLFPKPEKKKLRLKDYKIKRYRKNEAKKAEKEAKKAAKKQKKKAQKKSKSPAKPTDATAEKKEKKDIVGLVETVLSVAKVFLSRFGHHLRIDVKKIVLTVATGDAAKTAILYGAVCGAMQGLVTFLENKANFKTDRDSDIRVEIDFLAEKPSADIDLAFSFRIWQIFDLAFRSLFAFIKATLHKKSENQS